MTEWCTIESDPGVFTELISNIGVKGVQVEEILDLDMLGLEDKQTYGLVFLFKYVSNSGYNPEVKMNYDEDLYFAKQVITNACATQAILGILMNKADKLAIGSDLEDLKSFTMLMDPYMKGLSISNCDKIRIEHNKFSKPEPFVFSQTRKATDDDDVFHYVSYIHFKNVIYEIDGMKEGPIVIAENIQESEWTNVIKPAILNRISLFAQNEIKFSLLSLVPDRILQAENDLFSISQRINYLKNNLGLSNSNEQDVEMTNDFPEYKNLSKEDKLKSLENLELKVSTLKMTIADENQKLEKYKTENQRRQHNYIPLVFEILKMMAEKNELENLLEEVQKEEEEKLKKQQENKK